MGFLKRKKKKPDFIRIETKPLIDWDEPNGDGCIVSDKITREGFKVGYMYRTEPHPDYPDSGWWFLAGNEDEDYMNDPANHHIFKINTLCNYDEGVIPYIHSPAGTEWVRVAGGKFEPDDGSNEILIEKR